MFPGLPEASFFQSEAAKARRFERDLDRKAFHAPLALHLTHASCLDGAACDALVRLALGPGAAETLYLSPHETLPTLERLTEIAGRARRLIISDLSLQKGQGERVADAIEALAAEGWRVEWRDHHHKQWEGVPMDRLREHASVDVDTTGTECGASLVAHALLPDDPFAEALARTVRDHDLWLRKIPLSDELEAAKAYAGSERFVARLVETRSLDDARLLGWAHRQHAINARLVKWALRRALVLERGGVKVGVAYGRVPTNLVLHDLEAKGARLNVLLKPDGAFSLRSAKGVDVCHLVAQEFGGGGHPNASGGHLGIRGRALLSYWMQRARHPRAGALVARALEAAAKA